MRARVVAVTIRAGVLLGNYAKKADPHTNWGRIRGGRKILSIRVIFFIKDQDTNRVVNRHSENRSLKFIIILTYDYNRGFVLSDV